MRPSSSCGGRGAGGGANCCQATPVRTSETVTERRSRAYDIPQGQQRWLYYVVSERMSQEASRRCARLRHLACGRGDHSHPPVPTVTPRSHYRAPVTFSCSSHLGRVHGDDLAVFEWLAEELRSKATEELERVTEVLDAHVGVERNVREPHNGRNDDLR